MHSDGEVDPAFIVLEDLSILIAQHNPKMLVEFLINQKHQIAENMFKPSMIDVHCVSMCRMVINYFKAVLILVSDAEDAQALREAICD